MAQLPCRNENCNSYGQPHPNCQCYGGYAGGGMAGHFCSKSQQHKEGCKYAKGGKVMGGFALHEDSPTHYTIKHPKGDVLKIAKRGLSKDLHDAIQKMAKGGQVQNFAEGTPETPVEEPNQSLPTNQPPNQSVPGGQPPVTININNGGDRQPASNNGFDPALRDQVRQGQTQGGGQGGGINEMAGKVWNWATQRQKLPQGQVPFNAKNFANVDEQMAYNKAVAGQNPQAPQSTPSQPTPELQNVDLSAYQPVNATAPAQPKMGMPQLPNMNKEIQAMQQNIAQTQQREQELYNRSMDVMKGLNEGKIDFNRVWNDKSTGDKILSGLGIIISGFGSGLSHSPNQAIEMINKTIDRDIEEQKANIGKKEVLLNKYLQMHGDVGLAATRLREDYASLIAAKMQQYEMNNKSMMMQAMNGGMNSGNPDNFLNTMRIFNPEFAKGLEGRYVPGVGFAQRQVNDKDIEEIQKRTEFHKQMEELKNVANELGGIEALKPENRAKVTYAKAKAKYALNSFRQMEGFGVPREASQKFEEGMIDQDPTKFLGFIRTIPKYQALQDANKMALTGKLKGLGFNIPEEQQSKATPRKVYRAASNSKP